MPKTSKAPFLPGPMPGEEVAVRSYKRRRSKANKTKSKKTEPSPTTESRPKAKQTSIRRSLRMQATRSSLKGAKRRSPTATTPESTGKANFPHDLEKGALIRRGAHISTRRRKTLDGELNQVNTSDWHAQLVD